MCQKWTERYLTLADTIAKWSKDPSRQVGAVIVRPDKTVASVGFNGFPRGMKDDEELYKDRDVKLKRVVHAEVNAILNAHESVQGYDAYITDYPCSGCAIMLIQSGIKTVTCPVPDEAMIDRWGHEFELAKGFFEEAGVQLNVV